MSHPQFQFEYDPGSGAAVVTLGPAPYGSSQVEQIDALFDSLLTASGRMRTDAIVLDLSNAVGGARFLGKLPLLHKWLGQLGMQLVVCGDHQGATALARFERLFPVLPDRRTACEWWASRAP